MDGSIFKDDRILGGIFPRFVWDPYRFTLEFSKDQTEIILALLKGCQQQHLVVLLAGPISHTSTRCMDFVEIFNIILDLSITCFSHFSGC